MIIKSSAMPVEASEAEAGKVRLGQQDDEMALRPHASAISGRFDRGEPSTGGGVCLLAARHGQSLRYHALSRVELERAVRSANVVQVTCHDVYGWSDPLQSYSKFGCDLTSRSGICSTCFSSHTLQMRPARRDQRAMGATIWVRDATPVGLERSLGASLASATPTTLKKPYTREEEGLYLCGLREGCRWWRRAHRHERRRPDGRRPCYPPFSEIRRRFVAADRPVTQSWGADSLTMDVRARRWSQSIQESHVSFGDEEATLRHLSSLSLNAPADLSRLIRVCACEATSHARASGAARKEVM